MFLPCRGQSFNIEVTTVWQYTNQYRAWNDFSGRRVSYIQRFSCKINLQVLSRAMVKMHGCFIAFIVPGKVFAKLGVAITIGKGYFVFLPKDTAGYPSLSKLFRKIGEVFLKPGITGVRNPDI